jgi:hypothetical protein
MFIRKFSICQYLSAIPWAFRSSMGPPKALTSASSHTLDHAFDGDGRQDVVKTKTCGRWLKHEAGGWLG